NQPIGEFDPRDFNCISSIFFLMRTQVFVILSFLREAMAPVVMDPESGEGFLDLDSTSTTSCTCLGKLSNLPGPQRTPSSFDQ
ncbi:hypothetical protein V4Y02_23900, partial [Escherichia coli]